MKKSLILIGMLSIGYAHAQEYDGKVGINIETPKATLDIQSNATNLAGTTNEGIIAPRLSKARIANIAVPVEGTLVYASEVAYTPVADATKNNRVAKITEKGYYFYNGTEWVKASAGTTVSSNIYTADGSTNGDRTVSTANGFLTIKGNAWNPLVVNSEIVPTDPNNNARGGFAVHPNDITKRVEFATTKDGDSRIWLDGDKLFIKRETGNIGIGNAKPSEKLDVSGSIKSSALAGTGARPVYADENGVLKIGATTTGETATSSFTRNIRVEDKDTTTITDNDYFVHFTSSNISNVDMPDLVANKGRVLCFHNQNAANIAITPQPRGGVQSVATASTVCVISSGAEWIMYSGF